MPARQALMGGLCAALLLLLQAGAAQAQVSCTLQAPAFTFGRVDILGAPLVDWTLGSFEVTCSNPGPGDTVVRLHIFLAGGGNEARRRMTGPGGSVLEYNLFRDVGRTQLWRASGNPPWELPVPANSQARLMLPVFGRLYGSPDAQVGGYTDSLTATVEY